MVRGVIGEWGGLSNELSSVCDAPGLKEKFGRVEVEGPNSCSEGLLAAPGLKLKLGSADRYAEPCSIGSTFILRCCVDGPAIDLGRRPIVLGEGEEADEEEGRAGNTNGGFGGGTPRWGEGCELESREGDGEAIAWLSKRVGIMIGPVGPSVPPIATLSMVLLGA